MKNSMDIVDEKNLLLDTVSLVVLPGDNSLPISKSDISRIAEETQAHLKTNPEKSKKNNIKIGPGIVLSRNIAHGEPVIVHAGILKQFKKPPSWHVDSRTKRV